MPKWLKLIPVIVFPFIFLICLFAYRYNFFDQYWLLIQEDAFFEWWQFIGYFGAGLLFMWQALHLKHWPPWMRIAMAVGAVLLIFVAGEEISWGQRIFEIKNPDYFNQHNVQAELSLHNLDTVQSVLHLGYIILCLGLTFAQPLLISILHLTRHSKQLSKTLKYVKEAAPPWYLGGYFLPVSAFYSLFVFWKPFGAVMRNGVLLMVGRDQEVFESLLAMGIMITALLFVLHHRSKKAQ